MDSRQHFNVINVKKCISNGSFIVTLYHSHLPKIFQASTKIFQLSDKNLWRQAKQEGKREQELQMSETIPDRAQQRGKNWLCSIRITDPYLTPLIWKNNTFLHVTWTNPEETGSLTLVYLSSLSNAYLSSFSSQSRPHSLGKPQPGVGSAAPAPLSHHHPSCRVDWATQSACATWVQFDTPICHFVFPPSPQGILPDREEFLRNKQRNNEQQAYP